MVSSSTTGINFFSEDVSFKLRQEKTISEWILKVVKAENFELTTLNFIFCSDEYLLSINREYLNKNYFTDVITFDQSVVKNELEGDIFISIDRVKENCADLQVNFNLELCRVMIHGILHLIGYSDYSKEQIEEMRKKEEACLSLLDLKGST